MAISAIVILPGAAAANTTVPAACCLDLTKGRTNAPRIRYTHQLRPSPLLTCYSKMRVFNVLILFILGQI